MKLPLLLLLGLFSYSSSSNATLGQWHYPGKLDHEEWSKEFPNCGGKHQSPVDLSRFSSEQDIFEPFVFIYYNEVPDQAVIINNGHVLEVDITLKKQPKLLGGNLGSTYVFSQFHLHWGGTDLEGSEHTVNSVRYPMELHLVHYNIDYGNFSAAYNYTDGLAVLAIFFEISPTDNPALAPLLAHLDATHRHVGIQNVTDLYPLASMLPMDTASFYRYHGSLTTPPCNEVVTWTIFDDAIPVSEAQLTLIRSLEDSEAHPLVNNYRGTQPLHGRTVFRSY